MKVKYKGYTLILDFSSKDHLVPTLVEELNHLFKDVAQAKKYIDSLEGGK